MRDMLLGGLTSAQFLRRHWQKKPLLIRNAIPGFGDVLELRDLIELAGLGECESRLIVRSGNTWRVRHGPLDQRHLRNLPARGWTLLVHGVEHFVPAARVLLSRFSFIPHARIDDLMVSFAPPGGGVGAHFDSYDVFLLQGSGRRNWQVSAQSDLALLEDVPLKLLSRFRPEGQCVLDPGDMLYLPPNIAHNGVAIDDCFTYSIGFRAPAFNELKSHFLAYLDDRIQLAGRYRDPDLTPASHAGRIDGRMIARVAAALAPISHDRSMIAEFLGCYLSEPKGHVVFDRPPAIGFDQFVSRARRRGVSLAPFSRLLLQQARGFINGESFALNHRNRRVMVSLADRGMIAGEAIPNARNTLRTLYGWFRDGYIEFNHPTAK